MSKLFQELKRRNVFRVGVAYIVASWVLLQVADLVLDTISAPAWALQAMLMFVVLGFIAALIIAWAYEITAEGIKRETDVDRSQSITHETAGRLNRITIGLLVAVVAVMLIERFVLEPRQALDAPDKQTAQLESQAEPDSAASDVSSAAVKSQSIAVLPFVAMSSGVDDEYFADGLTEEILNSLAQLPELLVTSRTSSFQFKGKDIPALQNIAASLGVANIVEGSVRRSGDRLRVTAQLIRAEDGFHLWSNNYDSNSVDTITVQEDIAEKIAVALNVVMDDKKRQAMRRAGLRDVEAFIAYQKGIEIYDRAHGDMDMIEGLRQANQYFETVIERTPGFAPVYRDRSDLFVHILNRDALKTPMPTVTALEIAGAMQRLTADHTASVEFARTPEERHNAEFDLAMVTGNWRGLTGRIDLIMDDRGCDETTWLPPLAPPFGYGEQFLVRLNEFLECNPMNSSSWLSASRSAHWLGDTVAALDFANRGSEIAPGSWLNMMLVRALVAAGEYDQAEQVITTRLQVSTDVLTQGALVAAARGDLDSTRELLEKFKLQPTANGFSEIQFHAWMGDQSNANRLATEFDQHSFGHFALVSVINWCSCGAPFDLVATPNFAARLEESGLPWPPASPITFPLKDW